MDNFLSFIADIFDVPADTLSPDTEFGSVPCWDSLMQIRLVAEISDEYDVDIPIDEVPDIRTPRDFYRYIEENN